MIDENSLYAHIWEGNYARREGFLMAVNKLNREIPGSALTGAVVYWSDNPYDLRFLIHLSFNPEYENIDNIVLFVNEVMSPVARLRGDVTPNILMSSLAKKQLNMESLVSNKDFSDPCAIKSLKKYESEGWFPIDWGKSKNRVFLSHQSERKSQVAKLQMLLSNSEIPTWFDKIDIGYGKKIVEEIEKGIDQSTAVIFWISPKFLESNWCKYEFEAFLDNYARYQSVTMFPIVEEGLDANDNFPKALSRFKYLTVDHKKSTETIASELVPSLRCGLQN